MTDQARHSFLFRLPSGACAGGKTECDEPFGRELRVKDSGSNDSTEMNFYSVVSYEHRHWLKPRSKSTHPWKFLARYFARRWSRSDMDQETDDSWTTRTNHKPNNLQPSLMKEALGRSSPGAFFIRRMGAQASLEFAKPLQKLAYWFRD